MKEHDIKCPHCGDDPGHEEMDLYGIEDGETYSTTHQCESCEQAFVIGCTAHFEWKVSKIEWKSKP